MHNKSSLFTILSMLCLFAFNNVNASENTSESELTFTISKEERREMKDMNELYAFAVKKFAGQITVKQLDEEYYMSLYSKTKNEDTICFTKKTEDQ